MARTGSPGWSGGRDQSACLIRAVGERSGRVRVRHTAHFVTTALPPCPRATVRQIFPVQFPRRGAGPQASAPGLPPGWSAGQNVPAPGVLQGAGPRADRAVRARIVPCNPVAAAGASMPVHTRQCLYRLSGRPQRWQKRKNQDACLLQPGQDKPRWTRTALNPGLTPMARNPTNSHERPCRRFLCSLTRSLYVRRR